MSLSLDDVLRTCRHGMTHTIQCNTIRKQRLELLCVCMCMCMCICVSLCVHMFVCVCVWVGGGGSSLKPTLFQQHIIMSFWKFSFLCVFKILLFAFVSYYGRWNVVPLPMVPLGNLLHTVGRCKHFKIEAA